MEAGVSGNKPTTLPPQAKKEPHNGGKRSSMTEVRRIPGGITAEELETSLSFFPKLPDHPIEFQSGFEVEIRRLISWGYEPHVINDFEKGRRVALFYLPKSLYRFPFRRKKRTLSPEGRAKAQKQLQRAKTARKLSQQREK